MWSMPRSGKIVWNILSFVATDMAKVSPYIIGITGGIGSGKSVVSRICRLKGYPVYDCDTEARSLMEQSASLRTEISALLGDYVYTDSCHLKRDVVASRIFSDDELRSRLNTLVHTAVRADFRQWAKRQNSDLAFVEAAVFSSGLDKEVNQIWLIEASEQLRVERACRRGGVSASEILPRIRAQRSEYDSLPSEKLQRIVNDGICPLLPQVDFLIGDLPINGVI